MENKGPKKDNSRQVAIIGLIGTLLTVCGGLSGALIGGTVTLYKVEQAAHQLKLSDPQADQSLAVDTREIEIQPGAVSDLDADEYLVFSDLGFILGQPAEGWELGNQESYADLFLERSVNLSPLILFYQWIGFDWDDQPVRQVRYTQPVMVQYVQGSTENGIPVDPTGLESDTIAFYSQLTVLALDKAVTGEDFNIYSLALKWGGMHQGGVNNLIADPDRPYVFEQVSWEIKGVKIDGKRTDLTLQRWALFAEGPGRNYIVEVQYVPAPGQSSRVWDELQACLDAFRIIQE